MISHCPDPRGLQQINSALGVNVGASLSLGLSGCLLDVDRLPGIGRGVFRFVSFSLAPSLVELGIAFVPLSLECLFCFGAGDGLVGLDKGSTSTASIESLALISSSSFGGGSSGIVTGFPSPAGCSRPGVDPSELSWSGVGRSTLSDGLLCLAATFSCFSAMDNVAIKRRIQAQILVLIFLNIKPK